MKKEPAQQYEDAKAINHTIQEAGAGGRREIFSWDGNFLDAKPQMSGLHKNFLIENEAIGIE
jgi:hypothetical protein